MSVYRMYEDMNLRKAQATIQTITRGKVILVDCMQHLEYEVLDFENVKPNIPCQSMWNNEFWSFYLVNGITIAFPQENHLYTIYESVPAKRQDVTARQLGLLLSQYYQKLPF